MATFSSHSNADTLTMEDGEEREDVEPQGIGGEDAQGNRGDHASLVP